MPPIRKRFRCIVSDPPWRVKKIIRKVRPNQKENLDYPTMDIEEIRNLEVEKFAEENCFLFLWTTNSYLKESFSVVEAWGFRYQRLLTWDKSNGMCLFGFHHRTEFCLFGYRGKINMYPRQKAFPTVFSGKSTQHSKKPEEFFSLVESYTSGPYLEMFARTKRPGWSAWGNEVESDVSIGPSVGDKCHAAD